MSKKISNSLGVFGKIIYLTNIAIKTSWIGVLASIYISGDLLNLFLGVVCFLIISFSFAGTGAFISTAFSASKYYSIVKNRFVKKSELSEFFTKKEILKIESMGYRNSTKTAHSGVKIIELTGIGLPISFVSHVVGNWIAIPSALLKGKLVKFLLAHEISHSSMVGGKAVMGTNLLIILHVISMLILVELNGVGLDRYLIYLILGLYLWFYFERGRVYAEAVADALAIEFIKGRDRIYIVNSVLKNRYSRSGNFFRSLINKLKQKIYWAYFKRDPNAYFITDIFLDYLPGICSILLAISYKSTYEADPIVLWLVLLLVIANYIIAVLFHQYCNRIYNQLQELE